MEETLLCPSCHQPIQSTDYFCGHCGKKLQNPPPSTSLASQLKLYALSLLFPPLGIFWSRKYFQQPDPKFQRIGLIAVGLTLFSLVVSIILTVNTLNSVTEQVNSQLNEFGLDTF